MRQALAFWIGVAMLTLVGCSDHAKRDKPKNSSGTATATKAKTIVVIRNPNDRSGKPEKVLKGLKLALLDVESGLASETAKTPSVAVIASALTVTPSLDEKVCLIVEQVYHGPVIRKVGGLIEAGTASKTGHKVEITLPMPGAVALPLPSDATIC